MTEYETILVETRGRVGWIALNRPEAAKFGQPEINLGVIAGMGGPSGPGGRLLQGGRADPHRTDDGCRGGRAVRARLTRRARGRPARRSREDGRGDRREEPAFAVRREGRAGRRDGGVARRGLRLERYVFASLFDTADQKEGMAAFREKRPPEFENR